MYNLNLLKGFFGTHHLYGWNYVRDEILKHYTHEESGIILDIFCERTFHNSWEKNWISKKYEYPDKWIGIIHTTPKSDKSNSNDEYIDNLFLNERFIKCLNKCVGIITLGISSYNYVNNYLKKENYNIPIYLFQHPFPEISKCKKFNFDEFLKNKRINHVGIHMRNIELFEQIKYKNKRLCYPKIFPDFDEKYFIENYIPNMNISNIKLENLSNEQYEKMLSSEIIFNNIYDMSGSNLICECIRYNTPIVINRIKQLEDLLGEKYPMFYDSIDNANLLIQNDTIIQKTSIYLKNIEYKISMKHFITCLRELK